ncbi:tetratricopeptide repeat protein [Streptomyces kanamyceticus]|uniref:Tetratricopeptide repeat protein n=1 Tax=Streptomyces kanamyceticus TaxID=1967 RepID=A0A5J6GB82_STRKN|nr:tetratricopeptide repeat protein [Streptomyces kanamyceticus]QEU92267.1 tetratricopeptide repeat protein [Streptomyces kanamyceticus]
MGRSLPSWDVPFAAESLPKEHLPLLMAVGTGMTDRIRFLEYFEEHAAEHHEGTYLLGLAHLQCGMPFGALLILSRLADERPEHVPVRVDLATALVHAGRPETARKVLEQTTETLTRRGGNLSARWLREVGERVAWIDRTMELRALEREFLVLRAAAWSEIPSEGAPSETLLLQAQTLCALGELDEDPAPLWEAAGIVVEVLAAAPGRISALEMLVRIARSGLPMSAQRGALDSLRQLAPGSPALKAARASTLEERALRRREGESEWYVIQGDIEHGDDETRQRAVERIQRRAMCGDYRSPFLAAWISFTSHADHADRSETLRGLSEEVTQETDMAPDDLLVIAESLARCGLRTEALDHARRCAHQTDDQDAATRAEAFMEALDGTTR